MKVKASTRNILLLVLVGVVILAFAYMLVPRDIAKEIQAKHVVQDKKRFTPGESIDVAMAMKLVTHEAPKMLNPPNEMPLLVLYPPSADELKRLSGE